MPRDSLVVARGNPGARQQIVDVDCGIVRPSTKPGAAAERAIASVPGKLASRPDEIEDDAVRTKIIDLNDRGHGIYLVAEHASTVVGHELVRSARSNPHVEKVELQVRSSNGRAIALYRSLGFVEEGRKTRRLKIGPNEYVDDVYMALWVGP